MSDHSPAICPTPSTASTCCRGLGPDWILRSNVQEPPICGEVNLYLRVMLMAHGELHWGRVALNRLLLYASLCGSAYAAPLEQPEALLTETHWGHDLRCRQFPHLPEFEARQWPWH